MARAKDSVNQSITAVGQLYGGILVIACLFGLYAWLDESGWISHSHNTPTWIQGDWIVGEYRDCGMRTQMQPAPSDDLGKLPRMFCSQDAIGYVDFQLETTTIRHNSGIAVGSVTDDAFDSYFHVLPVHYYGRIDRQNKWVIDWRCQRKSESLTCKALD